ncbi:MAG: hypothetical protein KF876_05985 [Nitrospira sp.]|nr:hypothetical protein [Nitrospira sp.]MDR4463223.1 hypothetical protein [Nitrospira sp.]
MMSDRSRVRPSGVSRSLVNELMKFYDFPHPHHPKRIIRGYDRPHALRTARMCVAVASRLGHPHDRVQRYHVACLLHDLGRAGLDRQLFGTIWSWAKQRGIPTRPREWRAIHPGTTYGRETEAFVSLYRRDLEADGVPLDAWAIEQIEMRLGYARRLARRLRSLRPALKKLGVGWEPWMQQVMLYYYYPERLTKAKVWVRQLAEILVACEQFEAYSNRRRGQDYYARKKESLPEAFAYLEKLEQEGILSSEVLNAVRFLSAEGAFDTVLMEARGEPLTRSDRRYLRRFKGENV